MGPSLVGKDESMPLGTLKHCIPCSAKKKEVRVVEAPADLAAHQEILKLYVPEKSKETQLIDGAPAEAAAELVRILKEEARVL